MIDALHVADAILSNNPAAGVRLAVAGVNVLTSADAAPVPDGLDIPDVLGAYARWLATGRAVLGWY